MAKPATKPFTPEEIERIEKLATVHHLKVRTIADALGISKRTFYRKLHLTPGVKGTLKKARARSLSNVAKTAYDLAVSGRCPAMTMFYLKCHGGWREKDRVVVTGKDGGPIQHAHKGSVSYVTVERVTEEGPAGEIRLETRRK